MKKTLRVLVWVIVLSLCFAALFAGCTKAGADAGTEGDGDGDVAQTEGPGELPEGEITLTMWHNFGADAESPYFDETIMGLFHEAYPNIKVEVVDQGNEQYNELITTNIATGTTPDVARLDSMQIARMANQEALAALDQFTDFNEVAGSLFGSGIEMGFFQGSHYALPLDIDCKAAVCDMDVLGQLGFEAPPATMEEFIDACMNTRPGEPMISVSGTGDWDIYPYLWLFGGVVTDEGYTTASGYINSPETIAAVTKLKEVHDAGVFTIKDIDGTIDAWEGSRQDEYAMFFEGPWFYPCTEGWQDMNLVPALIPTYNGQTVSVSGGNSIVMFETSQNKAAAFALMKFLVGEEAQLSMMDGMSKIPVNINAANNEALTSDPVLSVYVEQLDSARPRIPSPYDSEIAEAVTDEFNAIFYDEVSVEEGLNQLAERIDEILTRD